MKRIHLLSIAATVALMVGGCSGKYDASPKKLDLKKERAPKFVPKLTAKKGQTFKDLIASLDHNQTDRVILDKTRTEIIFDQDLIDFSLKEILSYIKLNYGVEFSIKKYSPKIFLIEEKDTHGVIDRIKGDPSLIPNIQIETSGELTYADLFNELRRQEVNIYTEISKKGSFDTNKALPDFKGTLPQFLRLTAVQENLFVETENGGICLKDVTTKIYDLKLPKIKMQPALTAEGSAGAISLTSTINNGSGSSGGTTSVSATSVEEVDPLADLDVAMKEMFKGDVDYNINMSSGTLTVRANRRDMDAVDQIVKKFQDIYDKHIQIEMHIYEITLNDANEFGVDYSDLGNELIGSGIGATVASTGSSVSTGLSAGVIDATAGSLGFSRNSGIISVAQEDGTFAQSAERTQGVIFKYLNKFGRASVLTKPTLGTINNFPVKLNIIDSLDYVYKLSQTQATTATTLTPTTTSTIEPEIQTVKTGFSLVLHPRIEGEYIKIALKSVVSNLNALHQYVYGVNPEINPNGNLIQLKDVSAREFTQTIKLKEGEIAIVGGYQYSKKTSTKNGLPFTDAEDSAFDMLTSAKASSKQKVEIVITLQAVAR